MTWAKISDSFGDDPVLLGLERGIRLLWVELTVWACKHETDGYLPRHVLRRVTDEPDPDAGIAALLEVGLVEEMDHGWQLIGFLNNQVSAAEIKARRADAAERAERHRRHWAGDHAICQARYCNFAVTRDASRDEPRESRPPVPARPDPTRAKAEGRKGRARGPGSADAAPEPRAVLMNRPAGQITVDLSNIDQQLEDLDLARLREELGSPIGGLP